MNQIYAIRTKGETIGKKVLIGESIYPYNKFNLSGLKQRIIFNSLEFGETVKLDIKNKERE